jgi:hypothetical protein
MAFAIIRKGVYTITMARHRKLISVAAAADMARVSRAAVWQAIDRGQLDGNFRYEGDQAAVDPAAVKALWPAGPRTRGRKPAEA